MGKGPFIQAMFLARFLRGDIEEYPSFFLGIKVVKIMFVLITYDVSTVTETGKRFHKMVKQCVNFGRRVNNLVFECLLDNVQCVMLKSILTDIIDAEVDSLRF